MPTDTDTPDVDTPPGPPDAPNDTPEQPDLGDAGKKAIEAERRARRDAEQRAKRLESELEQFRVSQMSEQEKAIVLARAEGAREASTKVTRRLAEAEVRAAAAGRLADPADAIRLLDIDSFIPDGDGDIDAAAIAAAIDQLVTSKPYLAPTTRPNPGFVPTGAKGDTPRQFSRSQLRDPAFYAANEAEILKAAREGRITND
jgi:hypothetical protein